MILQLGYKLVLKFICDSEEPDEDIVTTLRRSTIYNEFFSPPYLPIDDPGLSCLRPQIYPLEPQDGYCSSPLQSMTFPAQSPSPSRRREPDEYYETNS